MPAYHIYEYQGKQYHCGCTPQRFPGRLRAYRAMRPVYTLAQITTASQMAKARCSNGSGRS